MVGRYYQSATKLRVWARHFGTSHFSRLLKWQITCEDHFLPWIETPWKKSLLTLSQRLSIWIWNGVYAKAVKKLCNILYVLKQNVREKKHVEIESSVGKHEEHMHGSQTCHPHYITRFDFHVSDIVHKQIVLATERTNECNLNMQKSFY